MRAFAGASGAYPIPRYRVVVDGGQVLCVYADSAERARAIVRTMYGRETAQVTPVVEPGDEAPIGMT